MDILKEINVVVDPAEFRTGKSGGDADKKRARARLNQIGIEFRQLTNKIIHTEIELLRLKEKLDDKEKRYTGEARKLIKTLEDSPDNE